MQQIEIQKISEEDFDGIVERAGGRRFLTPSTADYELNEAVIELKLLEEEGFEKDSRRRKIAAIFRELFPRKPVVPIVPSLLNKNQLRLYTSAIEGPIQTHVKKASIQLKQTADKLEGGRTRVLVILNNGYTALSPEEFKEICVKRTQNDTRNIDWLVCGGMYHYGDGMEHYMIARFEEVPINLDTPFPSFPLLVEQWGKWLDEAMRNMLLDPQGNGKPPLVDIVFDVDQVRYVKPTPEFPQSNIWPSGVAPRSNSSGMTACPPVGRTYPDFTEEQWCQFREKLPSERRLENSYSNWRSSKTSREMDGDRLKVSVSVPLSQEDLEVEFKRLGRELDFDDLLDLSVELFDRRTRKLIEGRKDIDECNVMPLDYVLLEVEEIGQDMVNDVCSLFYVSNVNGFERCEVIFEDLRMFFAHGIVVASAQAFKRRTDSIFYRKTRIFG